MRLYDPHILAHLKGALYNPHIQANLKVRLYDADLQAGPSPQYGIGINRSLLRISSSSSCSSALLTGPGFPSAMT